ncbi:hypothetical protein R70723_06810 [Paenibacillus sp. FSL R7-0273]|uniref:hypothetical protein n=1 Tax=Paenibacillus sp. FSL R7-0273 TaxID=1536772 RepID=UPI0004F880EF|nr:hypothetical protein [Paenibacillus sp. FSL R7-0273]AIQ45635.1 hypothetical protein R70723_06810 [Paenibacillus sp. FSL R7-0273]OMF95156.1 hypothetical protein BK144_06365 [Paenibacillus sp. FSL R7-0273]
MYYEKLLNIFQKNQLSRYFSLSLVQYLDEFIDWNLNKSKRDLSPFHFANLAGIKSDQALRFFMYYAREGGIFELVYFFECSTLTCGERIYLDADSSREVNYRLFCDECAKSYNSNEIKRYIKIYFHLKEKIYENVVEDNVYDPNCAFDAINRMPDDLKLESPSSSINIESTTSGGENTVINTVTLEQVIEINQNSEQPIITDPFLLEMTTFIHS